MKNEIIIINKEKGVTSRDVVNDLCKILNTKKIGHAGTLDPLATGVLVCLTNKYTKLINFITNETKEYIATIKLGIKTDTLDITGNVIDEGYNYNVSYVDIVDVLNSFKGSYFQEVPKFSAVHVNGKRLYEYARKGEEVLLPKKEVSIKDIELMKFLNDEITIKCLVSKGTYIRSLIKDICDKLNVLGTMSELTRTKQGNFLINDSYTIDDIKNGNYRSFQLEDIISLQKVELDNELYKKVINGNIINDKLNGFILFKKESKDIALYNFENNVGRLIVLF